MSAFATASRVLASEDPPPKRDFPAEARPTGDYLEAAEKVPTLQCRMKRRTGFYKHFLARSSGVPSDSLQSMAVHGNWSMRNGT